MIFAKPWADALIVLLVVLLFFGPKRLPALGKSLGQGMREFKDSITGSHSDGDESAHLTQPPLADPAPSTAAQSESSAPAASSEYRS